MAQTTGSAITTRGEGSRSLLFVGEVTPLRQQLFDQLPQLELSVEQARDTEEGCRAFDRQQPCMVLLAPEEFTLAGCPLLRHIRGNGQYVPVVLLLEGEPAPAQCLACESNCSVDAFLHLPVSLFELHTVIEGQLSSCRVQTRLRQQNRELGQFQATMLREQEVAQSLFYAVVERGRLQEEGLRYLYSSKSALGGDVLLSAYSVNGDLNILLGDFTGHGLSAAVGALPVAEIFYAMSRQGFPMQEILMEINSKLLKILPTDMFFAACMLIINAGKQDRMSAWNGGMPDIAIVHDGEIRHLPSNHLPLGIVDAEHLELQPEHLSLPAGARIYAYTDGVTETLNAEGTAFGQERLEACLLHEDGFDYAMSELRRFVRGAEQLDDMSMVEVCPGRLPVHSPVQESGATFEPFPWRMELQLNAHQLSEKDPLPKIMRLLTELHGLGARREDIYVVISELFSNALEHGLLGLDSTIKDSPQGFAEYYNERDRRLRALQKGSITISLAHRARENEGRLYVEVKDSGSGFDFQRLNLSELPLNRLFGRGLPLVNALCSSLKILGRGNHTVAEYYWRDEPDQPETEPTSP